MKSILKYIICILIFIAGYPLFAQVGINTDNPQTMLDVNGNLALNAGSLSLSSGNNNMVVDDHSLFNVTGSTGDFSINTIQPLNDVDGQVITLVNTTAYSMTLIHNDGGSANSIFCTSESDLVLKGIYTTVTLQYNKTLQRWLAVKFADGEVSKKRIFSSVGTIDTSTDSPDFSAMADVDITFTPQSHTVYVNVSLAGNMSLLGSNDKPSQGHGDFRLVKTVDGVSTVVAGFTTLATDIDFKSSTVTAWNSRMAMYPVAVTPGLSTLFQVEWRSDGQNPGTLLCNPLTSPDRSHSSITILD